VAHRGPGEELERDVVQHLVAVDDPAVPVRGVFAEADVREEDEPRHPFAERAQRLLDDPVVVVGARAGLVLLLRDPEEDHGRDPGAVRGLGLVAEAVDRALRDARQALERPLDALAGDGEERVHEVVERETRLPDERPERRGAAKAP
jgi:hypothetical protein